MNVQLYNDKATQFKSDEKSFICKYLGRIKLSLLSLSSTDEFNNKDPLCSQRSKMSLCLKNEN